MTRASDNPFPSVLVLEGTTPTSPASGNQRCYIDSADHKLKRVNSSGTVVTVEGGGGATPVILLDFAKTSDTSALSVPSSTWTDVEANQTFTVGSASSLVEIILRGSCFIQTTTGMSLALRLVIDSAGTPISKLLSGAQTPTGTTNNSPFPGAAPVYLSGLTAAAHTVKLQAYANASGANYYCRPTSDPNIEFLNIQIIEHK